MIRCQNLTAYIYAAWPTEVDVSQGNIIIRYLNSPIFFRTTCVLVTAFETTNFLILSRFAALIKRLCNKKKYFETKRSVGPLVICNDHYPPEFEKSLCHMDIPGDVSSVFYLNKNNKDNIVEQHHVVQNSQEIVDFIISKNIQDVIFVENIKNDEAGNNVREELLLELLALPIRIWLAVNLNREFSVIVKHKRKDYKTVLVVDDKLVHSNNKKKRIFDFLIASLLLIIFLPLLACIALLVRMSSPGPIIFRQIRVGAQGKKFEVMKFRTMIFGTDTSIQATFDDPRVTRIGRVLRRTSLDELLQLINVIKGEMSLVGPRPHAIETKVQGIEFHNAITFYRGRYRVKPGITGLAQIRGLRGETKFIEKLEQRVLSDLEYIERWSIWLDILIMLQTLPVIFIQKNAH